MLTKEKLDEIGTKLNIPLENPLHTLPMRLGFSFRFSQFSMCERECFMKLQGMHNNRDCSQHLLGLVTCEKC